ncbi:hypothetical protein [Prevotella koreensis]|uniref:hypothetical protein n=1 Tax=Prevotella koreensis TaxID=2490854 RepID=UPI0028E3FE74|nr:hypothetical protein [Prevotella koreensis]
MKKIISYSLILLTILAVSSCGKLANKAAKAYMKQATNESLKIDVLTQPQELKKWYDTIAKKLGEGASVTDVISLNVTELREENANLLINLLCQSKEDKRKVVEIIFSSEATGWLEPETKEIEFSNGDKENFNLEDELFDLKEIPYANLQKIVDAAMKKYEDKEKYEYQYIQNITIEKNSIQITVSGRLISNNVDKEKYYNTDFAGNEKNDD